MNSSSSRELFVVKGNKRSEKRNNFNYEVAFYRDYRFASRSYHHISMNMRKPGRNDEDDQDWGVRRPTMQRESSSNNSAVRGRWIISGVASIIFLYIALSLFAKNTNKHSENIILESKFIPNSPQSQGMQGKAVQSQPKENRATPEPVKDNSNKKKKKGKAKNCDKQWTSDKLVGRCFGLSPHSKYRELSHVEIVHSPNDCKALCCELGDQVRRHVLIRAYIHKCTVYT